jgi:hypothetical protein
MAKGESIKVKPVGVFKIKDEESSYWHDTRNMFKKTMVADVDAFKKVMYSGTYPQLLTDVSIYCNLEFRGMSIESLPSFISYYNGLYRFASDLGNGKGSVSLNGNWHEITLKNTSERWQGQTGHTVSMTVTVEDLEAADLIIKDIKFKVERTDNTGGKSGTLGETKCNDLPINPYAAPVPDTYYLTPSNYGVANGKWHGPAITRTLPADASGEIGASNFILSFSSKMRIGTETNDTRQLGAMQVQITDTNGKHLAGLRIMKSAAGKNANIAFFLNGMQYVKEYAIDLSQNKTINGIIQKTGNKFVFTVGSTTITVNNANELTDVKAQNITFMFAQHSVNPALSYNGLYNVKFVKNNCDTYKDIPNKFSANDVLEADCESGKVYLNGVENAGLGALGNDWEGFYLTPGLNQIGFSYSDWVSADYAPAVKVRYREVFL